MNIKIENDENDENDENGVRFSVAENDDITISIENSSGFSLASAKIELFELVKLLNVLRTYNDD